MTDTFEFTLNNPLTEEQWDMIADVDMERTDSITFQTKHGKEVEFSKVRLGKWIDKSYESGPCWRTLYECSECGAQTSADIKQFKYCPHCGARMDADD